MEKNEQVEKNNNPNWQYIGKLKDMSALQIEGSSLYLAKTDTTILLLKAKILNPIHFGQTVKVSKKDNTVKIGNQFLEKVVTEESQED